MHPALPLTSLERLGRLRVRVTQLSDGRARERDAEVLLHLVALGGGHEAPPDRPQRRRRGDTRLPCSDTTRHEGQQLGWIVRGGSRVWSGTTNPQQWLEPGALHPPPQGKGPIVYTMHSCATLFCVKQFHSLVRTQGLPPSLADIPSHNKPNTLVLENVTELSRASS